MATDVPRPSFYALAPGGWRDYVTLLHPPYTAWHLSFVVIGAALAPELEPSRLLPTLAAFFLALGIGAHALDELNGRPLRTQIPDPVLVALAVASIVGAVAVGIAGAVLVDPWIGAFVAAGAFIVVAYNLELAGGRFHGDAWFALAWGAFPLVTGYFAATGRLDAVALAGALFAFGLSRAQRLLSTPVRDVRRRVIRVEGSLQRRDGSSEPVTPELLLRGKEAALQTLALSTMALAITLVIMRVT
ncbi:MAG TPA: UbiA family prenyltransferase [Gaiellaceae bacterium]|nr:UbiA family prenyltransferase [Gaiellaceae bacterium]